MKSIKKSACTLLILFWVGVNQIYWQLSPHISTYNNESLHTSLLLLLQSTTAIGPDLIILVIGVLTTQYSISTKQFIIKIWLNTLILSGIVCCCLMLLTNYITSTTIYDSFFPILRNTFPLISGSIIGSLVGKIINQLPDSWQEKAIFLIIFLIILPICSTPNMFGWVEQSMTLFYALLFVLGQYSFILSTKQSIQAFIKIGISAYLLNCFLQIIMPSFSINGSTIHRFATPSNVLIVTIAFAILVIIKNNLSSIWLIFSFLTLIESPAIKAFLVETVNTSIGHSTLKTGIIIIPIIILMICIAWLWTYLTKFKIISKKIYSITLFANNSLSKQVNLLKTKLITKIATLFQLLISYLLALASMLAIGGGWRIKPNTGLNYNIFAYLLGQRQLMIILNALFIFLALKFIQTITRRYWISLALVLLINTAFIIANLEKIAARSEPVLPADISMLNVGKQLFGMVSQQIWITVSLILIIIIIATIWLECHHPIKIHWTITHSIIYCCLLPLMLLSSLAWNHPGKPLNNFLHSLGNDPSFYNQLSGARINGPLIQYLNNVDVTIMIKPNGYSKANMQRIVKYYKHEAQQINRHRSNSLADQTIIFNLSESFANPNRVPGVKLKNNPIPFITKMSKQNTGGIMVSSGYGGGTANMEYMTLTGYSLCNFSPTLPTPYTQLVPNLKDNPSIVREFKHSIAIHPYIGTFYSRNTVYYKFGFQRFMYLGSQYPIKHQFKIDRSPYLSDKTAYANTLDQINNQQRSQFINLVTMQNHFPYDQHFYNNNPKYTATKVSTGTNIDAVNDFSTGINYTNNYLQQFIKQIDRIQKPITIVFYGDHLPGIYGNDMEKDGLKLHETDYFIYSNSYARSHGARNLSKSTNFVTPNDFIAMVAKQTNSKVNWYQALLTNVFEKLPALTINTSKSTTNAYNTSSEFINQQGKVVKQSNLTKQQKQILNDYRLVQYDVTAGKHYVNKYLK